MSERIDEIKEVLAAATPRPWKWSSRSRTLGDGDWSDTEFSVGDLSHPLDARSSHTILDVQTNKWGQPMIYCWNEGAADLIAKAPEYITYLLKENERKDEALRQIKTLIPLVQEELGSPSLRYNAGKEIVRKIERALREAL